MAAMALPFAAAAGQPPAARETVLTTTDCVMVEPDSNSPPTLKHCGFRRVELNRAGDRLLSTSLSGTVQLWDRTGRELLKVQTRPYSGVLGGAMIAGDDLYVFDTADRLIRFDLRDGREVSRRQAPAGGAVFMQVYGDHHVLALQQGVADGKYGVLDLRSGQWVRRWDHLRPAWDGSGRVIGTHDVKVAPDTWQTRIVLADAALTEVPVGFTCELALAEQACAGRDEKGAGVSMLDLGSRAVRRYEVPALNESYRGLTWLGGVERPLAMTCEILSSTSGAPQTRCAVVDAAAERTLYRFEAGQNYKVAAGKAPGGADEIRIAIAQGWSSLFRVMRVDMAGKAVAVGPESEEVGLTSLFGDLLIGLPDEPGMAAVAGADGLTDRRVPLRFALCVPRNGCSASADKSVAAMTESGPMREEADAAMDRIRWFDTGEVSER